MNTRCITGSKVLILPAVTLCLALCCGLEPRAAAQSYSIDWFTIDGGGGMSTGGVFSVSGTIGQPDAGQMSGGNFGVSGGFWGIIAAVQIPNGPFLTIARTVTNTVAISCPSPSSGFTLKHEWCGDRELEQRGDLTVRRRSREDADCESTDRQPLLPPVQALNHSSSHGFTSISKNNLFRGPELAFSFVVSGK